MQLRELRRHAGRMALIGFDGGSVQDDIRRLIAEFDLAGIICTHNNLSEPRQALELSRELRTLRREWPLWIGFEPAANATFGEPFTAWPPLSTLGRARDRDLAGRFASAVASELRAVGVDFVFWPPLDVVSASNPVISREHALSDDAGTVAALARVIVRSLQDAGLAACGGHFPGIGRAIAQAKDEPLLLDADPAEFEVLEFAPFRAAIDEQVAGLAVADVLVPSVDEQHAAAASKIIVELTLKQKLHFDGVVVADTGHPESQPVELIGAGCDVLFLRSCTIDAQVRALEELIHAAETGGIPLKRVENAWSRQRRVKERSAELASMPRANVDVNVVASLAHQRIAGEMRAWL
jgi:beta-N-acetylhexosaminidase